MNLLNEIKKIQDERTAAKRAPTHALFYADLMKLGIPKDDLIVQLNILKRKGKIEIGDTINDKCIWLTK